MTEESDCPSIKDGSDTDFEFACTPCGEDDIREEAVKYCPECREYLCVTCTRHHGRQNATRSHRLLDTQDAKQSSSVAKATKCRYHGDRDIEMYCGTHDMVYCTKCIATEHRSCSGVTNIEDATKINIQQNDVQHLQNETETIQERLISIANLSKKGIDTSEEQRNKILQQFQDIERELTEHIWKLKGDATEALNKNYGEVKEELECDVNAVNGLVSEIEESKHQLQTISNVGATQQFVQMKLIQKTVADAKALYESKKSKESKTLRFKENIDLRSSVMKATSFGQVDVHAGCIGQTSKTSNRKYKLKAKRDINVKMQNDSTKCFIADVCQLQDGTVILADRFNKKLKRLDKNFNIKDHCDLEASPLGLCCTGQNEIAVKMKTKIQLIFVGTVFSKLLDFSVKSGEYYGIAYCGGELWVSTGSGVIVYSTTGKLLKSIDKDESGETISKWEHSTWLLVMIL